MLVLARLSISLYFSIPFCLLPLPVTCLLILSAPCCSPSEELFNPPALHVVCAFRSALCLPELSWRDFIRLYPQNSPFIQRLKLMTKSGQKCRSTGKLQDTVLHLWEQPSLNLMRLFHCFSAANYGEPHHIHFKLSCRKEQ